MFNNFFDKDFQFDSDTFLEIDNTINNLLPKNHIVKYYKIGYKNNQKFLVGKYTNKLEEKTLFIFNDQIGKFIDYPDLSLLGISGAEFNEFYIDSDDEFALFIVKDGDSVFGYIYTMFGEYVYDAQLELIGKGEHEYIIEKSTVVAVIKEANKYRFYSNNKNISGGQVLDAYDEYTNNDYDN